MKVYKLILILVFVGILFVLSGCDNAVKPDDYATLVINSTPEGATIILEGDSTGYVTPANLEIDPGDHVCKLILNGYNDYTISFSVEKGDTYTINAILNDSRTLIVNSIPTGANINLDGEFTGYVTPDTLEINPGNHELRLQLTGYQDYAEIFFIEAGSTYTVYVDLIENATLIVDSTPQGAAIILDSTMTGEVTPKTLSIDPGNHDLSLELTGYQDYFESFTVNSGETYNVDAILENIQITSLQISSIPSGASIYIDGTYTGLFTPNTIEGLATGNHFLRLYKAGYNEYNESCYLVEGTPYIVNADLGTPQPPLPVFDIIYPFDQQHFDDNVIYLQADVELDNGNPFIGNTAILTLNGFDYEINVYSGAIYDDISITAGENTIQLRANSENGDTGVSDVITVYGDFEAAEIEVVLWWNTPTSDLDLHAWNPYGEHCWYGNMVISDGSLDIDDTEGYGPETFAVPVANVGFYEIQINCYDLDDDDFADATVQVFFDGELEATYGPHHFIVADYNGTDPLAWWEVCTIEVTGRGEVSITNKPLSPEMRDKIMFDKMNLHEKK